MKTISNTLLLSRFPKALFIPVMVLLIALLGSQAARATGVCYVNASASGANNGASWADAYTDLQSALGASPCTEVWVAAGTYKPASGSDRAISFVLKNGVALYGGFAGTEIDLSQCDPVANATILSGDIGTLSDGTDNSYHVVSGGGTDGTAVLNGFTITAGNANGDYPNNEGGGMYNENSGPSLLNVTFSANSASYEGSGIYNFSSNPTLSNVTFSNNNSAIHGGGIANYYSSPSLSNVTFSGNSAYYGGGIYNFSSSPSLTSVTFSANVSNIGGGVYNSYNSNLSLVNVTFNGNTASVYGGGVVNSESSLSLKNVTFSGNSAVISGGGIFNYPSNGGSPVILIIKDSIFWGNGTEIVNGTPMIDDSLVEGGCPTNATCNGNIVNANPLVGPLANNGGFTQTMALGAGSPAIDTGKDATCATTDQRGVARPQGTHCDMGAYEYVDPTIPTTTPTVTVTGTLPTQILTRTPTATFTSAATLTITPTITPTVTAQATGTLFVAPGGNDGNTCTTSLFPCATIQGAIEKAPSDYTIKVALGTYTATGNQVVFINKDIHLSGGWDTSFSSQNGRATIDGENARWEVWIDSNVTATLDHFTLQNGKGGILNYGDLTASYMLVQNNHGDNYCWGGGITNQGTMLIQWSTVNGNSCNYGYGGGIYNWQYGGSLIILNSTINNNQAATGGGIYNHNLLTVINSTISNNTTTFGSSDSGGGGIYNDSSSMVLKNVTITNNEGAESGGGIFFRSTYGGSVTLSNTILANNTANVDSDCSGLISSTGYNIIGDTTGCSFSNTTGDQINVNPKLGPLQDNGGPTFTRWLYAGSPAIDRGNPIGCVDHLWSPLTIDQRGYTRPLDGDSDGNSVCDIGAYEADPNNLPPPSPESLWYVTPMGSNSNDCHSPDTSCATINAAIGKATSGDTIYISTGVYTPTAGSEVVLIDKNINISGGWNAAFTAQTSLSTIDGQHNQRGITINGQITVKLENFNIQNGLAPYADILGYGGGGVYIGYRSNVTLTDSIVRENTAGSNDPSHPSSSNGGGIGMNNYANLIVNNSLITGNSAYGLGGGIYSGGSTLTLNDSTLSNNAASKGGGISGGINGQIELNHSNVIGNVSTNPVDGGGGINSSSNTLTLKNSSVTGNIAAGEGGGIVGDTMTIENSTISSNKAANGGGISSWYTVDIRNSAILHNTATSGNGGGIYSRADLVIVNTTIAYNTAENPSAYQASGGGIFRAGGYIQASNVSIVGNFAEDSGGGISNQSAPVTLRNTLLAENQAVVGPDCTGTMSTEGYNLIGDTSGCSFSPAAGDLINIDPRIALLYRWPGTLALRVDSPAIEGGNPGGCADQLGNPITVDQIGAVRPLDGNGDGSFICDIGAFEYDPAHPPHWIFLPVIMR